MALLFQRAAPVANVTQNSEKLFKAFGAVVASRLSKRANYLIGRPRLNAGRSDTLHAERLPHQTTLRKQNGQDREAPFALHFVLLASVRPTNGT